ncbi:hypothetical protein SLEP1_g46877 [Rubroshorea leprosula]|uniref:BRCT domain-containing protein n=1 Tax=Rubroshorea leprosula TaxID=152421 RepID=A0AAV5LQI0_9ROSI|nr:hypothetical protein SLEP1_g46877 [Rubroshorea leprosula]
MGSLGDGASEFKPSEGHQHADFAHTETQPFDSQSSPLQFPGDEINDGDADELQFTAPFYDDFLVDDPMETQVVSLVEETQVLNFGGETQVLDDPYCIENMGMGTQLLDEFDDEVALDGDGEGTDTTEILSDGDELPDDKSVRRDHSPSLGEKNIKCSSPCAHNKKCSMGRSDDFTDEQRSSGPPDSVMMPEVKAIPKPKSGPAPKFTAVRAESLRASGLAARNLALKGIEKGPSSVLTDNQFVNQFTVHNSNNGSNAEVEDNVRVHGVEKNETLEILSNVNNSKVGGSAARKLLYEEAVTDANRFSSTTEDSDARVDLDPLCDVPLAGLSYIDSQEPGELSQANALNFVDRLINFNLKESDVEVGHIKCFRGKSKPVSSAKGPKDLAKKTNERILFGETCIFDWDDTCEDDRGGDIFCRKKEEFFGRGSHARKSYTEPRRPKGRKLYECRDKKEQPCDDDQIMAHSDSKVMYEDTKEKEQTGQDAEMNFRRNLVTEFDQQCNIDVSRGQVETTATEANMLELQDVGFDTQMAAEAMEALGYEVEITDHGANVNCQGDQNELKGSPKPSPRVKPRKRVLRRQTTAGIEVCRSDTDLAIRRSKRKRQSIGLCEEPSILLKKCSKNVRKKCDTESLMPKTKRTKPIFEKHHAANGGEDLGRICKSVNERIKDAPMERSQPHESTTLHRTGKLAGDSLVKRSYLQEKLCASTPIAHRTRQSMIVNLKRAEKTPTDHTEVSNPSVEASSLQEKRTGSFPKQRRSCQKMSVNNHECNNSDALHKPSVLLEEKGKSNDKPKRSRSNIRSTCVDLTMRRETRSAARNSAGKVAEKSSDKEESNSKQQGLGVDVHQISADMNGKMKSRIMGVKVINHSDRSDAVSLASVEADFTLHKSPKDKPDPSVCITPVNHATPIKAASPVCIGGEYFKQSCKKNLSRTSLLNEIRSLNPSEPDPISPLKDTRKRRDLADIRVMFSHHLDDDIIKQQRKISVRLGIPEVSSILDATHFVTDKFVRTRNMLEAMASGKPVVTHLWLESVGQVNIHIDEETCLLRDIKKEKEFGFCMPVSLARARKHPLLEGRRVFITPNTKPGKDIISSLVKAVHGKAVERISRSVLKDDKIPDDMLVLSCEDDFATCVPFLEKGAAVYSSELLLNGIVTQRLEYERHRLFAEQVKRTRSTIWLKSNDKFLPVTKLK